jgi:tetratricopeptide (TPR) repeat protein
MKGLLVLLLIAVVLCPALSGQDSEANRQLVLVFNLEEHGRFEEALEKAKPLIDSHALSPDENGRALILLGYAYEQRNRFQEARQAFEESIRTFEGNPKLVSDYATALEYLADLYRVTQQPQLSKKLLSKALDIHKKSGDHQAMATTYSNLAETEAELKHVEAVKRFLRESLTEERLVPNRTNKDNAFICETEGWLASVSGDFASAIEHSKCSLKLLTVIYGENYQRTGWAYINLGKDYADNKQFREALASMQKGLSILERTVGPRHVQYLTGELLYSQVLERSGAHEEASRLSAQVKESVDTLYRAKCLDCTVSVAGLR